jgi:hypothetical protein
MPSSRLAKLASFMKKSANLLGIGLGLSIGVLSGLAPAFADDGLPPIPPALDPAGTVDPITIVSGSGVKVGEGTVFHPQIGIETGVVSNVFYQADGPVTAGLLRILAEIGTSSLPNSRLNQRAEGPEPDQGTALTATASGDFLYSADLYASYDQYLSNNDHVTSQGGLGGGLLLRGIVSPQHPLQFAFQEHFTRVIRATNFESNADTNRDLNALDLRVNYMPYGSSLNGFLYYQNTIDVFEASSQQFANRLQNTFGVHVNWRWLPLTQVYVDVSEGYNTGIGSSDKVTSYPLIASAGIQTALTLNTTVDAHLGYANGFYANGPSYSSVTGGVLFGYRYSPFGRVTLLYDYEHQDSINANFYRDHVLQLSIEHLVAPFVVFARPELRFRRYDGTVVMGTTGNTRDDVIFGATVGMRYSFRDWIAATLDYQLQDIQTDFRYNDGSGNQVDPSYIRHELLLGVRAAY